ncbi:hypothetical protein [Pseudonocardia kunmingensis]|uniref:Uncharacterized protein n=1 Tax=Pseudonocardia kunmingensis TaxID=630975 RepID=A0A543DIL3_9PSEU|nr:hypothetical protein [Pseudonocardia kunmingensis]TQM09105.1 hypothetical protein FB558_4850 [Pseudonocardia kunmingensis]
MTNSPPLGRLPVLTRVTALALLGSALAFAAEMIYLGLGLSVSVITACVLVAAALTAVGWRWTAMLGAATIAFITANNPFLVENLSFGHGTLMFVSTAVNLGCAVVAVVAGLGATVANYRPGAGHRSLASAGAR